MASTFREIFTGQPVDAFEWEILGRNLVYIAVETFVLMGVILLVENNHFEKVSVWAREKYRYIFVLFLASL